MKTVALILASLALLACTAESGVDFDKTLTHPNGLVVERPSASTRGAAPRASASTKAASCATHANWRSSAGTRRPPDLASRRLGDGEARYKVEEDDGGSAGSEYRLWAAKPAGARWIVVSASEQSEDGEPTFALAWALLERARLQSNRSLRSAGRSVEPPSIRAEQHPARVAVALFRSVCAHRIFPDIFCFIVLRLRRAAVFRRCAQQFAQFF